MTEFCYNGSNINAMKGLGEMTHFDISGHFAITKFDIEGVCSIYIYIYTLPYQKYSYTNKYPCSGSTKYPVGS